jgi:organic radical activating enzyme
MTTDTNETVTATAKGRSPGKKSADVELPVILPPSSRHVKEHKFRMHNGEKVYDLVEIYSSVKGEGTQAGMRMLFVRFAKCNLKCDFCDTPYDRVGISMPQSELISHILGRVEAGGWVIFTGGEPMVQLDPKVTGALKEAGVRMAIESNGMIWNDAWYDIDYINISPKVVYDVPGNVIPVDKRIAKELVEAVRLDKITINELRHIICSGRDDVVKLPSGFVSEWTTLSPLMYDSNPIPEGWESGQGHTGFYGHVDQEAMNRCMDLIAQRKGNYRLSVQVHKFVGVR